MAAAAPFLNANVIARANVVDRQLGMGQADAAADRRLEQRLLNANAIARVNIVDGQPDMDQADAAADRRLERRLHFYAVVYMMLGTSSLFRAIVPYARAHATSCHSNAFEATIGISLWASAITLVFLSFYIRRFPMATQAAARLAQAALRAFF